MHGELDLEHLPESISAWYKSSMSEDENPEEDLNIDSDEWDSS